MFLRNIFLITCFCLSFLKHFSCSAYNIFLYSSKICFKESDGALWKHEYCISLAIFFSSKRDTSSGCKSNGRPKNISCLGFFGRQPMNSPIIR